MSTTKLSIVLFADDVMLLAERKEDMETNLMELGNEDTLGQN